MIPVELELFSERTKVNLGIMSKYKWEAHVSNV